jgi:uracil phosphoribosyltransferase
MIRILTQQYSVLSDIIAKMRDVHFQKDSYRFRTHMEMAAMLGGYEISRALPNEKKDIQTPLGIAQHSVLKDDLVIASILRAGIPMHDGLLKVFPDAGNAFIGAYRKHHKNNHLEIALDYLSSPPLDGKTLILADPMLATGQSIVLTLQEMFKRAGVPRHTHIFVMIASRQGIDFIKSKLPSAHYTLWCGAVDEELSSQYYIVPGLGDAGDLSYGPKS